MKNIANKSNIYNHYGWIITFKNYESYVLWPPHVKSWLIGKDPDAGRDWGQEEKGTTEDEMGGWHHWLDGRKSEWTPGVGDGQRGLASCDSWGRKESDMTERLNWTDIVHMIVHQLYLNLKKKHNYSVISFEKEHILLFLCIILFDFNLILTKRRMTTERKKLMYVLLKYMYVTFAKRKYLYPQLNCFVKTKNVEFNVHVSLIETKTWEVVLLVWGFISNWQ